MLSGKTIVLGITGGIAAYKAVDIASSLVKEGATVEVVMTESATKFVSPLTFHSLTGRPVLTDVFNMDSGRRISHVTLGEAADVVVIAPATAATIAKLATGICDDMLTLIVMATKAPIVVAPAMNVNMYENPITQANIARLKGIGFTFIAPVYGRLASGATGMGRLADNAKIIGVMKQVLGRSGDLKAKKVVVTAGGTQEPIDPVRHIGNRSSGKMGYAVAEAARDRGADVVLITAPSALAEPAGMEVVRIQTAIEMKKAVDKAVTKADALIMTAAVADFQAKTAAKNKIKKEGAGLTLALERTPDILAEVKGDFIKVGFAAETEDFVANAKKKLEKKQLDLIVANDVTDKESGFAVDTNRVTIISRDGKAEKLPLLSKREVADKVLDRVVGLLGKR